VIQHCTVHNMQGRGMCHLAMYTACGGGAMYIAYGGGAYVIQQCIQHGSVHSMWGVGQHHISNDKLMETI